MTWINGVSCRIWEISSSVFNCWHSPNVGSSGVKFQISWKKKKIMELSSKMIIFFKELSVNFHPWLYQNLWHRSGDTVQELMTCSHCRICQPCLLSYQTAKRYANDTYRVSIKNRYVSYRIVPAKRYEPLIPQHCSCLIIKSPRLCFWFVSAASAAAKTFPSHVKTAWAKPLIFGTKNI